jgi:class 3 adenylate cyclase
MPEPESNEITVVAPLTQPPALLAVLFADLVGSTRLYDTVGDAQAKMMIDECIDLMRSVALQHGGRVVKTIGDEAMCVLPDANAACLAAIDMQLKIMALAPVANVKRSIRVGFHYGWVIEDDNDVYGDTVNVAARMAGLAKGMQIITTLATVQTLSPMMRASTRQLAALAVKGKGEDVDVCEVIWQGGVELTMMTPSQSASNRPAKIELRLGTDQWLLEQSNTNIVLGRDASCQVVLADRMASRQHALIECRRGKFFISDRSTNGTFVSFDGEHELTLRREELMLRGKGRIVFGHSIDESAEEIVYFSVTG